MPVASKESIEMAEKMLLGEIETLKLRVDRIEKVIASIEGDEEEEPTEEEEDEEEAEVLQVATPEELNYKPTPIIHE